MSNTFFEASNTKITKQKIWTGIGQLWQNACCHFISYNMHHCKLKRQLIKVEKIERQNLSLNLSYACVGRK